MTAEALEQHLAVVTRQMTAAVRAFLGGARSEAALLRLVGDAYAFERETRDALVKGLSRDPKCLPVCAPGCAYCCHLSVFASVPEILFLAAALRATLDVASLATVTARVVEAAAAFVGASREVRASAKRSCPLLAVANGCCSVYEVRPLVCRAYNSCDVGVCKTAFDDALVHWEMPVDLVQLSASRNVRSGLLAGIFASGLDPGPYELACGLAVALTVDDAAERWLAGDALFSAAETAIGRTLRATWRETFARDARAT
jgi:Fe-S-cluster containining protein